MARIKKMSTVARAGTRLEQLKNLAKVLADQIDQNTTGIEGQKLIAQLAKQYRETIKEIEEIEGGLEDGDEISKILKERDADGKPDPIR